MEGMMLGFPKGDFLQPAQKRFVKILKSTKELDAYKVDMHNDQPVFIGYKGGKVVLEQPITVKGGWGHENKNPAATY